MRNRYYLPAIGRFISRDPIGLTGGLNMYPYAGDDPTNVVDPYGLLAIGVTLGVSFEEMPGGGAVIAMTANYITQKIENPGGPLNIVKLAGAGVGGALGSAGGSAATDLAQEWRYENFVQELSNQIGSFFPSFTFSTIGTYLGAKLEELYRQTGAFSVECGSCGGNSTSGNGLTAPETDTPGYSGDPSGANGWGDFGSPPSGGGGLGDSPGPGIAGGGVPL